MNTLYVRDLLGLYVPAATETILAEAKRRIAQRLRRGTPLTSPAQVREVLQIKFSDYEREVFACLFLDNRHRLIQFLELFFGTIDAASIHPREVVKAALKVNAAAVIFCHNHPSGFAEPSAADKTVTERLKAALGTVDIRVLDHFIVGGEELYAFTEHGLL